MGSEQDKSTKVCVDFSHPCAGKVTIFDHEKALVEELCPDGSPRTKVAIIGYAATTRDLAPYHDPEWSVWGLNQLYRLIPRADRWFDIHANWNEHTVEGTDHEKWLAEAPIPIYMVDRVPSIPNSVKYPVERVLSSGGHPDYFTSTIAYCIALAIDEGFKEIGLWGIDLIVGEEYGYQKPCAEFWIGVAHGKGITVTVPKESALVKQSHRYGYEVEPRSLIKFSELQARTKELLDERHKLMIKLSLIDGAIQQNDIWKDLVELRMKGSAIKL